MRYQDPQEFVAFNGADLTSGWLRVNLRLLGRRQEPQLGPPKHPFFDDTGWAQLPPDWVWSPLPVVNVVFKRLALRRFPAIQYSIQPDKHRLGQGSFENCLAMLPGRLFAPYAGKIRFELHAEKRRQFCKDFDVRIGGVWPQAGPS